MNARMRKDARVRSREPEAAETRREDEPRIVIQHEMGCPESRAEHHVNKARQHANLRCRQRLRAT